MNLKSILMLLLLATIAFPPQAVLGEESDVQEAAGAKLPERLDVDWILIYEQAYGVEGLYIDEPPPRGDLPAQCRANLLTLTRASQTWHILHEEPPTVEGLKNAKRIEEVPVCPQGGEYTWNAKAKRFDCTTGGGHSLAAGALRQLMGTELYQQRVNTAPKSVREAWEKLYKDPETPVLIKKEVETRMFALRYTDSPEIRQLLRVQSLLGELSSAIELAAAAGLLEKGQEIAMKDVGETGMIDMLEALPGDGRYRVTKVGEPPVAVYPAGEIPFSVQVLIDKMRELADKAMEQYPGYPPAIALQARYMEGPDSLEMIDRAIVLWPDVPAFHIQRIAINARLSRVKDFTKDLDYLLARFPAAPILLEIDQATRLGSVGGAAPIRASIGAPMAAVRPEVLTVQLLAMKYLTAAGHRDQASILYQRLIEVTPGYEPLLSSDGDFERRLPRRTQ